MKNTLFLLILACSVFTLAAQPSNLTLSEFVYNEIRYVVPLGDTSRLVVADVTAEENFYGLTPHLFRLDALGHTEWAVTLPRHAFESGVTAFHYDPLLQRCYVVMSGFDCDAVAADAVYSYDLAGNLLWSAIPEPYSLITYNNAEATVALLPQTGLLRQVESEITDAPVLRFQPADGSDYTDYPLDNFYDGVYHWRNDTLLLLRENEMFFARLDDGTLNIMNDQSFIPGDDGLLHLAANGDIYTLRSGLLRRYGYNPLNGTFAQTATISVTAANDVRRLTLGEDNLHLTHDTYVTTYDLDLNPVSEHLLIIPGTALHGAASNGETLLVYGTSDIYGNEEYRFPRESFLYDLTSAPTLNRDLTINNVTAGGLTITELPEGIVRSRIDSIYVTVRNAGADTVTDLTVKVQKSVQSYICPGSVRLEERFAEIFLPPGDSLTFFMGTLEASGYLSSSLCAWVAADDAPVETDYTNNYLCTNVDIINAVSAPDEWMPINVFPNPTAGFIQLSTNGEWERYTVYDALGRPVRSGGLPPTFGDILLDLTGLRDGIYTIYLEGERRARARVVVSF